MVVIHDDLIDRLAKIRAESSANHGTLSVRTMQQAAVRFTVMTVRKFHAIAPDARALVGVPAHHPVIWNVAP